MTTCPHPEKHSHRTRYAALKARDSLEAARGIDLALKPYLCVCGAWHLGHRPVKLKTILRRGRAASAAARRRRPR